jgi:hypothetical protein
MSAKSKGGAVCFMAKSERGMLIVSIGGRASRLDAIDAITSSRKLPWKKLYDIGYRIVRVKISEIPA